MFVKLSNADRERPLKVAISLQAFAYVPGVRVVLLNAVDTKKRNTFANPDAVQPVEKSYNAQRAVQWIFRLTRWRCCHSESNSSLGPKQEGIACTTLLRSALPLDWTDAER